MAKTHEIKPGESLLELAYEGGFDSWKKVWDDPANAELRERRKDPQVLLPGDAVIVPDKKTDPKESCPVDKVHRFRVVRPRAWVNLRMLDGEGEPIVGARFALRTDGETHEGTTDANGMLSAEIRPNAHEWTLKLWFDDDQPPFEAPVKVGHLDPISAPSGLHGRLTNLMTPRASDFVEWASLALEDPTAQITHTHDEG